MSQATWPDESHVQRRSTWRTISPPSCSNGLGDELSELHRNFADIYARVTDKSPTKLAGLLEYAYKRDAFLNDERLSRVQKFNLGLELAEQAPPGLSSELYQNLQNLTDGEPERISQLGLTFLRLSKEQPSSFLRIFGETLRSTIGIERSRRGVPVREGCQRSSLQS